MARRGSALPLLTVAIACCLACLAIAAAVVRSEGPQPVSRAEAEARATRWVGTGALQDAVRDGRKWEIDVRRPNGSVVEVELDDELRLLGVDEEVGPGGGPAHDELLGTERARAVRAALASVGTAVVRSVERDHSGEIEVDVRRPDGTHLEIELDDGLRVVEVERD